MKYLKILLIISLFSVLLIACDDDNPSGNDNELKIISFQPSSGVPGSSVYITVENFEGTASQLTVMFTEEKTAQITEVVELESGYSRIEVTVPEEAETGEISVTYAGTTAITDSPFTVTAIAQGILPTAPGTYWIYQTNELDSLNNVISDDSSIDSVAVVGSINKLEKEAAIYEKHSFEDGEFNLKGEHYYYEEENRIYAYSSILDDFLDMSGYPITLPFEIEEQWFKIADPMETEWEVYKKVFDNDTIGGYPVNGSLTITSSRIGQMSLELAGLTLTAYQYTMSISFLGTMEIIPTQPNEIDLTRNIHFWYAEDYGEVKRRMEAMLLNIPGLTDGPQPIPGYEFYMINFSNP